MEWRLVATKGRESCRWQATDASWVALTLGSQGDITKVVVTSSDSRTETVDGYEQGLNLARKWRQEWQHSDSPPSSSSGPWLPPLPGRNSDGLGDDQGPPSRPPPDSLPPRPTLPSPDTLTLPRQNLGPVSPTTRNRSSYPPDAPHTPSRPMDSPQSRLSQTAGRVSPPSSSQPGSVSNDERAAYDGREPRPRTTQSSNRSINAAPRPESSGSDSETSHGPNKPPGPRR
jgi:hypothetical protein